METAEVVRSRACDTKSWLFGGRRDRLQSRELQDGDVRSWLEKAA